MKKILFILENLGGGGAERVLPCLLKYMDRTRFAITVLTLFEGGINRKRLPDGIKYVCRHAFHFHGITYLIKWFSPKLLYHFYVEKILKGEKFDIVIAYMNGLPTKVAAGASCKKVTWLHGNFNVKETLNFPKNFISFGNMLRCMESFDGIVGVSHAICDSFKDFAGISQDVRLIHNTIDLEEIRQKAEESNPYKENGSKQGCIRLVTVGHLQPVKGNDRLLEAVTQLKDEKYNFHLTILGEGPERHALEKYVREHNLDSYVAMPGHINNPYPYIKNADIYVCPSRSEGFSTAVSEAIILGLPVISTRVSGADEMLGEQNEYGIICDNSAEGIYKALKQMLEEPQIRKHYAQQARQRSSMFQPEKTAGDVEQLIDEILE